MKHHATESAFRESRRRRQATCIILLGLSSLYPSTGALAQSHCEHPIADLAACPPCPASPKCREADPSQMPSYNGCGPEKFSSLIENGVIPQGFGAADFRNGGCELPRTCGCNQHDVCYGTCNSDKSTCDNAFRKDLMNECFKKFPVTKNDGCSDGLCFSNQDRLGMCLSRARLYYKLVSGAGQEAYNDAQKQACQCCGPGGMLYCSCNKQCYAGQDECLAECKVGLGCFTAICGPATPDQCSQ